jgi:hypothetical protein
MNFNEKYKTLKKTLKKNILLNNKLLVLLDAEDDFCRTTIQNPELIAEKISTNMAIFKKTRKDLESMYSLKKYKLTLKDLKNYKVIRIKKEKNATSSTTKMPTQPSKICTMTSETINFDETLSFLDDLNNDEK